MEEVVLPTDTDSETDERGPNKPNPGSNFASFITKYPELTKSKARTICCNAVPDDSPLELEFEDEEGPAA